DLKRMKTLIVPHAIFGFHYKPKPPRAVFFSASPDQEQLRRHTQKFCFPVRSAKIKTGKYAILSTQGFP
ncbi:MAG: hypothetical protein ACI32F_02635, partial [Allobaculum sp.]